jgi:hypothetical protein
MATQMTDQRMQAMVLAGASLNQMTGVMSEKFDTFATWLLAGFGAAVGLLLTSHDAANFVSASAIRIGSELFVAALIVTLIEKYLAVIAIGGSKAAADAKELMEKFMKDRRESDLPITFEFETFKAEILRALFFPVKWVAVRQMTGFSRCDFNGSARLLAKISQAQGALMLVEVGLFIAAVFNAVASVPK